MASQRNVCFPEVLDRFFIDDGSENDIDDFDNGWGPDSDEIEEKSEIMFESGDNTAMLTQYVIFFLICFEEW